MGIPTQNRIVLSLSGMFLLLTTKFADALTTGVALGYVPEIYERNPIAWYAFDTLGIARGLLVGSFVIVVGITVVTETASMAIAVRRRDRHLTPLVRAVGYGLPSLVFAAVAIHNVTVILEGLEVAGIL